MSDDAFELMQNVPGVQGVHVLRNSLRVIVGSTLPIGPDGVNRPSLFPFATTTGPNAHCRSLFNCHTGLRSLIKFPDNKIGAYLDIRTQEVAIAAVKSVDDALLRAYASGDVYHCFAIDAGLTTERSAKTWKHTLEGATLRQKFKSLYLGINYGMGVPSIARRLNRHPLIASELLMLHQRRYLKFWAWRENEVWCAKLSRRMESDDGCPLHLTYSPNERSLLNFPMQSNGAVKLRAMASALCDAGLVPSMLVHDGIMIEFDDFEQIDQARAIMAKAASGCYGGFPIGVDEDQKRGFGLRFRDKRPVAQDTWQTIMDVLTAVGALA
jgi:DNA polymerase I